MSLHIQIRHDGTVPVFQQVVDQVVAQVAAGSLPAGTKLPPVRALAARLGIAANTVAKAYRQLEAEGHVRTQGRNGTVVQARPQAGQDELAAAATALVQVARARGLTLDQVIGLTRQTWDPPPRADPGVGG